MSVPSFLRLLEFMLDSSVSLELKVESAVALGSVARGTEDNIRSLIDAGAVSVLFKGLFRICGKH